MYRILKDKLDGIHEDAVDFAKRLVETGSESLHEAGAADLIEKELASGGYDEVFRDECGNVVGIMAGREGKPVILLNSHMDTVSKPAGGGGKNATGIEDGKLYGLGAADCKGGLAAQVYAGILLKRCLLPLKGTLIVAATVAEENGLSLGVRELIGHTLKRKMLGPDFAILGEPTGLGLYYGHDGWAEVDVKIEGQDPFNVDDAVESIISEMDDKKALAAEIHSENIRRVSAPVFRNNRFGRSASFRMACRVSGQDEIPGMVSNIAHSVRKSAESAGNVAVDVAVCSEKQKLYTGQVRSVRRIVKAWQTDPFNPMLVRVSQAMEAAGCAVHPGKWRLGRLGMGTAGSVLVQEYSIPSVGFGPGLEDQAHAAGEYVGLDAIRQAIYGTAAMAHALVGIPVCGWTSDDI